MDGNLKRIAAGTLLSLAALGLQLAMVVRVVERDAVLSVIGYAGLLAGMGVVLFGILGRRR